MQAAVIMMRPASDVFLKPLKLDLGHHLAWLRASIEIVRNDPLRAQWLRARTNMLKSDPLRAQLWQSYLNLTHEQKALLGTSDISGAINRIMASVERCPHVTQMTRDSETMRQARLFHQSHAGDTKRKYDKEEHHGEHDERILEMFATEHLREMGCMPPEEEAIAALCHDTKEDYRTRIGAIARFFNNKKIAKSVEHMTTPSAIGLSRLYPGLPVKKAVLKSLFKNARTRIYTQYEVWAKAIDSRDALVSYTRNIELGQIRVTSDENLADKKANPPIIHDKVLYDNIEARREFNDLLVLRAHKIAFDPSTPVSNLPYTKIANSFAPSFERDAANLAVAIERAVRDFQESLRPRQSSVTLYARPANRGLLVELGKRAASMLL